MEFNFNHHVYLHFAPPPNNPVSAQITKLEKTIMSALDNLIKEVNETKTINQSAVTLLQGLKTKLDDLIANGVDEAKLQALSDELDASTNALADAITANTPANPEPEPEQPA